MNTTRYAIVAGAVSLALFGWGCNPFQAAEDKINEKIGEKVTEGVLESVTGGKVDVSGGGKEVTYEDKMGGGTTKFGEDVKLPDDFSSEALVYPGSKIKGVTVSHKDGDLSWAMLESTDDAAKVSEWYESETKSKGWKQTSSMNFDGTSIIGWTKGENESFNVTVSPGKDEDEGKTTVMLSYKKETAGGAGEDGSQE